MKIVIIGGGVAGLASAIALAQKGMDITIYEAADAFSEVGAGLQIAPNGSKILNEFGVKLDGEFQPESLGMRYGSNGKVIFDTPLREAAIERWGAPYIHIHRHDLIEALVMRAGELPNIKIKMGIRGSYHDILDADVIIGADGIHSETLNSIKPDSTIDYTGWVAWRGLIHVKSLKRPPPPSALVWVKDQKHFVTTRVRNGDLVNFIGISQKLNWTASDWSYAAPDGGLADEFGDWCEPIAEIANQADNVFCWALRDRPPLQKYHKENIVLVGDAAHPMLPSFAQGAVQSLEDAQCLAALLPNLPVHEALAEYSNRRVPRATRIIQASQKNANLFHSTGLMGATTFTGSRILNKFKPEFFMNRLDWLYGYSQPSEIETSTHNNR